MPELLNLQDFAPLLNQVFTAQAQEGSLDLRLADAAPLRASGVGRPEPFSLIFIGPTNVLLGQGSYALEHPALPGLQVFLVPIGPSAAGMQYQAIFN